MDVGVSDGRIVGVHGRAVDRTNHGRLGPKGPAKMSTEQALAGMPLLRPSGARFVCLEPRPGHAVSRRCELPDRELINTGRDKRFVRRDEQGRFRESDDVGRSLTTDRRQPAQNVAKKGQGDRGDQKR